MKKKYTQESIIKKFREVHGNKYDYSKVKYVDTKTNVIIICPEHGEFPQTPNHHNSGRGCPMCKGKKISEQKRYTTESFIEEARGIHGDKYDYSNVKYIHCDIPVDIICPIHGIFPQPPRYHLRGSGCKECGKITSVEKRTTKKDEFIKRAREVHGDRYDYSKVEYKNNKTAVIIICPTHGEFPQTPVKHLAGQGCGKCYGNVKKTTEDFIKEAREVHGDRYDYSKSEYNGTNNNIIIICKEHGEFPQTPKNHIRRKQGCPECAKIQIALSERKPFSKVVEQLNEVHNNKYTYDEESYIDSKHDIKIVCPEHGEFRQQVDSHIRGCGCPACSHHISKCENEIFEYISTIYDGEIVKRCRTILSNNKELDIYLPEKQLAIEYNGMIWHSEKFNKDKNYHLNKLKECNEKGIKLIHIFEAEYLSNKELVLSKIRHLIDGSYDLEKVYARKCIVKEIDKNTARGFLEKNHIQGFVASTIYLGCYHNDILVGVMTFKKENDNKWELNRFATDINYRCIGIGSKLFKYFVKFNNPEEIKSFADRRWTVDKDNNLYVKLGFMLDKILRPDYKYTSGQEEYIHKFNFRKQKLLNKYPNKGLTEDMTEYEMTEKLGFYKIWDCGLFKYVWKK